MGHFVDKKGHDEYIAKQEKVVKLLEKQINSNSNDEKELLKKEIKELKEQITEYEKETLKLNI